MFIVLNSLFDKLLIESHLDFHFCNQLLVHVQFLRMETEVLILGLVRQVKRVSTDSINVDPLFRISHKKF